MDNQKSGSVEDWLRQIIDECMKNYNMILSDEKISKIHHKVIDVINKQPIYDSEFTTKLVDHNLEVIRFKTRGKKIYKALKMINLINKTFSAGGRTETQQVLCDEGFGCKICSNCGDIIVDGFSIDDDTKQYCGNECLSLSVSKVEYNKIHKDRQLYWKIFIK